MRSKPRGAGPGSTRQDGGTGQREQKEERNAEEKEQSREGEKGNGMRDGVWPVGKAGSRERSSARHGEGQHAERE